jgi:sortase A
MTVTEEEEIEDAEVLPSGARGPDGPTPASGEPEASARTARAVPAQAELSSQRQVVRLALVCVAVISTALLVDAFFVSAMQHRAAQSRQFARFRAELARGEAPVGQAGPLGGLLELGTPVALLDVPDAHIHEVVGEGTTPNVLTSGPGHTRTTPLPGQPGTSVILGRRATFGGPFKRLRSLKPGAVIRVTTGQGQSEYRVIGVRRRGDPLPPALAAGKGRLVLVTADGSAVSPSGVLYVDADLTTEPFPAPARARAVIGPSERPLGTDRNAVLSLVLWLEVMIAIAAAATWSWYRWGRLQTWIVFVPLILLTGVAAAGQFLRLLPNLS